VVLVVVLLRPSSRAAVRPPAVTVAARSDGPDLSLADLEASEAVLRVRRPHRVPARSRAPTGCGQAAGVREFPSQVPPPRPRQERRPRGSARRGLSKRTTCGAPTLTPLLARSGAQAHDVPGHAAVSVRHL